MQSTIWRNPRFLTYAIGLTIDRFGNALYMVVLPLLVYSITQSAIAMSIMAIAEFLPRAVCSLWIGAIVDRVSRRVILFSALAFQGLLSLLIAVLHTANLLEVWMLYIIGALLSIGFEFGRSAEMAVVPVMFWERRVEATSFLGSCHTMMFILGPTLAGFLLAVLSYDVLLWVNALTYIGPILMCIWSRIPHETDLGGVRSFGQMTQDIKEGIVCLFGSKLLLHLLLVITLSGIAGGGLLTLILYYLKNDLAATDQFISWAIAVNGVGFFLASVLLPKFRNTPQGKFMFVALLVNVGGMALFLVPSLWVLFAAMFVTAVGGFAFSVAKDVAIQSSVPNEMMGRVGGTMRMMLHITTSLSTALLGGLAAAFGAKTAFLAALLIMMVPLLWFINGPLRSFDGRQGEERASAVQGTDGKGVRG